ncbi:hypothetical protein Mapa_008128 [Marchantia paleacea]|nr:hypothetical protein Mapa_008128 [Marchantia paleacea]
MKGQSKQLSHSSKFSGRECPFISRNELWTDVSCRRHGRMEKSTFTASTTSQSASAHRGRSAVRVVAWQAASKR